MKKIIVIGLIILGITNIQAKEFIVDKIHSSIDFKVRHMMVSYTKGTFTDFSGTYNYDAKSKNLHSFRGVVKIASVNTNDEKRDKHLLGEDFFDVSKYPTMGIELLEFKNNIVKLDLTIKGITKEVKFKLVEISEESIDPWNNVRTGFTMEGSISRKAFGINFSKFIETGGVAVGDTVKIYLEIAGVLKK